MSIASISPTSVQANPAHVNPQVQTENSASTAQATQTVQKTVQAIKTDTITISNQAVKMASHTGNTTELKGVALVRSLKQQGQTIAQIALKTHLDAKTINNYLGVSTATTIAAPQIKQAATPETTTAPAAPANTTPGKSAATPAAKA